MAFGMASNLFQLNPNFLTHKCPSLSTKKHLFKHTEIYGPSEMIAYAPQDIFNPCLLLYDYALVKKMRPDQNDETPKVKRKKLWICQSAVDAVLSQICVIRLGLELCQGSGTW